RTDVVAAADVEHHFAVAPEPRVKTAVHAITNKGHVTEMLAVPTGLARRPNRDGPTVRSPPGSAAAAVTRRPPCGLRTRSGLVPSLRPTCTLSQRKSAPTCRSSCTTARSLRRETERRSSPTCVALRRERRAALTAR